MTPYDKTAMQAHVQELQSILFRADFYLKYIFEHYDFGLSNANQCFPLMDHDIGLKPGQRDLRLTLNGIDDQLIDMGHTLSRMTAHINPGSVSKQIIPFAKAVHTPIRKRRC